MKQRVRFSLSVACLLALLTVSALAQNQELQEAKKKAEQSAAEEEVKFRVELPKELVAKFGFEMKVVKGAPYSAMAEAETIETLADGNRIKNKIKTLVYRDGEGRTRREVVGKAQSVSTAVFISDPANSVNYFLDTQRRVAVKSNRQAPELKFAVEEELKQRDMKRRTQASGQVRRADDKEIVRRADDEEIVKKKRQPIAESLGQQVIEGVLCEGRRATTTIPAEEVGNELPITIVNEQWYSPELQVYVLTKQSDPRAGEATYRLTNIVRSEPDSSLFQVPADYRVEENSSDFGTVPPEPPKRVGRFGRVRKLKDRIRKLKDN